MLGKCINMYATHVHVFMVPVVGAKLMSPSSSTKPPLDSNPATCARDPACFGAQTLPLSLRAVRPGGCVSMIGVLSGLNVEASLGPIVARQLRLQGVTVGHRDGFEAMLRAMAQHELRPVLGDTFAFEDLKPAMEHLRRGGHFGKTLIQF